MDEEDSWGAFLLCQVMDTFNALVYIFKSLATNIAIHYICAC